MFPDSEPTVAAGPACARVEATVQTRRSFLGSLLGAIVALAGATFVYPVFAYLSPRKTVQANNVLLGVDGRPILLSEVARQGFVMGMGVNGEATIVMRYAGETRAFSAACTHLGCLVKWNPVAGEFLCPCHGGKFDADGVNTFGPPPSPLKRFHPFATPEGYIGLQEITT